EAERSPAAFAEAEQETSFRPPDGSIQAVYQRDNSMAQITGLPAGAVCCVVTVPRHVRKGRLRDDNLVTVVDIQCGQCIDGFPCITAGYREQIQDAVGLPLVIPVRKKDIKAGGMLLESRVR